MSTATPSKKLFENRAAQKAIPKNHHEIEDPNGLHIFDPSFHPHPPRHPIYIISKGRWEYNLTARGLDQLRIPYRIVVEPQEAQAYIDSLGEYGEKKVLVTDFSNLGKGSIPSRNFVWEHSRSLGAERHWIMDDNIGAKFGGRMRTLFRHNRNRKVPCASSAWYAAQESFADRYLNLAICGPNYYFFVPRKVGGIPPYYLNTRVYSTLLIRNDLPFRWRGRYNEDTDLCLRALKMGYCTVLFNAFTIYKAVTMTMKGGNTDELYKQDDAFDGRLEMAKSLQEQHPDITTITHKWGRYQHVVDYSGFKQKLIFRAGAKESLPHGQYEWGMMLDQEVAPDEWVELPHVPPKTNLRAIAE